MDAGTVAREELGGHDEPAGPLAAAARMDDVDASAPGVDGDEDEELDDVTAGLSCWPPADRRGDGDAPLLRVRTAGEATSEDAPDADDRLSDALDELDEILEGSVGRLAACCFPVDGRFCPDPDMRCSCHSSHRQPRDDAVVGIRTPVTNIMLISNSRRALLNAPLVRSIAITSPLRLIGNLPISALT